MGMYHYFIGDMELPLAPEKYTLRLPPANQTVRLADGRELNLLRPLGLREISFELLLPYLPSGEEIFNTSLLVSLEEYQVLEAADLGFDVRVSLRLKEYQERVCQKYAASL